MAGMNSGGVDIKVNAQWEVYALWALILIPIMIGIPLLFLWPELKQWRQTRWQRRLAKDWDKPSRIYVKSKVKPM